MNSTERGHTVLEIYLALGEAHEELNPEESPAKLGHEVYRLTGIAREKARKRLGDEWKIRRETGPRRGGSNALELDRRHAEAVVFELAQMASDSERPVYEDAVPRHLRPLRQAGGTQLVEKASQILFQPEKPAKEKVLFRPRSKARKKTPKIISQ